MTTAMPNYTIQPQQAQSQNPLVAALMAVTGQQPAANGSAYTPLDLISSREKAAQALLDEGTSTAPIRSPWQGAANLAKAIMGGYEKGQNEAQYQRNYQNQQIQNQRLIASLLGGGQGAQPQYNVPGNGAGNPAATVPMGSTLGLGGNPAQPTTTNGAPMPPVQPNMNTSTGGGAQSQGDPSQPLSVRNNNPGNLIDSPWTRSQPGYVGSNGRFAVFDSPQSGAAAMASNLGSYAHHGVDTLLGLTSRWAPAGDGGNDPVQYAKTISAQTGIPIDAKIDLNDPTTVSKIMPVMAAVERGGSGGTIPAQGQSASATGNLYQRLSQNPELASELASAMTSPYSTPGAQKAAETLYGALIQSQMPAPKEFKTLQDASGQQTGLAFDPRSGTATPLAMNGSAPRLDFSQPPQGQQLPQSPQQPLQNPMNAAVAGGLPQGGVPQGGLPQSPMTNAAIPPGQVQSEVRLNQLFNQNKDYLASRADGPLIQQQALMMLRGQIPYPQGAALKDPTIKAAVQFVGAADPQFNGSLYDSIKKAREAFQDSASPSSPGGQVLSVRTLMGQLKDLADSSEALGKYEGGTPLFNRVGNWAGEQFNNAGAHNQAYQDFNQKAQLLGPEVVKFMSGQGGSAEEREAVSKLVDPNASVTTRRTALNAISNVLQNKATALQKLSDAGANSPQNPNQVIDPQTRQNMDFIKGLQDPQFLQAYHNGTLSQGPDGRWRMPAPGMPGRFMVWNGGQ